MFRPSSATWSAVNLLFLVFGVLVPVHLAAEICLQGVQLTATITSRLPSEWSDDLNCERACEYIFVNAAFFNGTTDDNQHLSPCQNPYDVKQILSVADHKWSDNKDPMAKRCVCFVKISFPQLYWMPQGNIDCALGKVLGNLKASMTKKWQTVRGFVDSKGSTGQVISVDFKRTGAPILIARCKTK
ncbi:hypothetical protein BCR37DRAFT_375925 [Protomyces lactucae-debilis]|uniref:Uncharacterized protein n=1 Tax=Protomyces lactucae-debilis TaxID=2754530 RepID=A0A1Y2FXD9_PROLT|nr:uncharacterized protein BCR37DRAFT_375925 [Protomyces lactucae-debilis]ORY87954.1 hypothetical protein BCR37DRAFT_375925 [Protomyces lactucae-debilis]